MTSCIFLLPLLPLLALLCPLTSLVRTLPACLPSTSLLAPHYEPSELLPVPHQVYDHEEVPGSPYSVHDALELWGLQHCEMHWDRDPKGMDTKAIVGYSDDMVSHSITPAG